MQFRVTFEQETRHERAENIEFLAELAALRENIVYFSI